MGPLEIISLGLNKYKAHLSFMAFFSLLPRFKTLVGWFSPTGNGIGEWRKSCVDPKSLFGSPNRILGVKPYKMKMLMVLFSLIWNLSIACTPSVWQNVRVRRQLGRFDDYLSFVE